MGKSPVVSRGFLLFINIMSQVLAVGRELLRQVYCLWFHGFRRFWGLTAFRIRSLGQFYLSRSTFGRNPNTWEEERNIR